MAIVFNPPAGTTVAWDINRPIPDVLIPAPTGAVGDISYATAGLPPGVEINLDSLVIFGEPSAAGTGTFTLTATDADGPVDWTMDWQVLEYAQTMEVAPFGDLHFVVGQEYDFTFPTPQGGVPPYVWSIASPVFEDWPYDPRLPQGITLSGGRIFGTPTDTQDNQGRIWYSQVAQVSRTTEGNPTNRLRPIWQIPPRIENRFFDYENSRYDLTLMISRTRPTPGVAYGPSAPPGGLRVRYTSPSGHGNLDNRATPPYANPFIRITSVSNPDRTAVFPFASVTTAPRAAWQFFYSPTFPAVAPWLDSEANTGTQFRVEIGTEADYPITLRVTDSVGSAVDVPVMVRIAPLQTGAPPLPAITSPVVTAHRLDLNLTNTQPQYEREYALTDPDVANFHYTRFQGDALTLTRLTSARQYVLWIRYLDGGVAGPALRLPFQTLRAAGVVAAPAPIGLTFDRNPGDQEGVLDGALRVRWEEADVTTQGRGYSKQVVRAEQQLTEDGWVDMPFSTGATATWTERGLRNGQAYRIGIAARNLAGRGQHTEIVGTPQAGATDTDYRKIQLQVVLDLAGEGDPGGVEPWFDVSNRVLEAYLSGGREPKIDLSQTGEFHALIETDDDFINVEGTSLYRIDDLQDRLIFVNQVEDTAGGPRFVRKFRGVVNEARFETTGLEASIAIVARDVLSVAAQDIARVAETLPAETTGSRMIRILEAAEWVDGGVGLRSFRRDFINEGSKTCTQVNIEPGQVLELPLLEHLNLIAQSDGGRLYVLDGDLRFESASPITTVDGRITNLASSDPSTIRMAGTPILESDDTLLYNRFELRWPGSDQPVIPEETDAVTRSRRAFGVRNFDLFSEVITDLESTESLVRQLQRRYIEPRRWVSSLPVKAHLQPTEAAARLLRDLTLANSLRIDYLPPGAAEYISTNQRVEGVKIAYAKFDRQFVAVNMDISLLIPETASYFICSVEGADAFDSNQTFLAPRRDLDPALNSQGGRLPGGWRETTDLEYQVVSANRYNAYLALQTIPRYRSVAERDAGEGTAIVDGRACELILTDPDTGIREFWIMTYRGTDRQWVRELQMSQADANPTTRIWQLDDAVRGIIGRGSGNVLGEAAARTANVWS